jgi:S-adenosylmethionine hydrolase
MISSSTYSRIIYIDHYGNAITGLRAGALPNHARLAVNTYLVARAQVFSDVPAGQSFWYENSFGLVEIAVNRGSAAERLGLNLGQTVNPVLP